MHTAAQKLTQPERAWAADILPMSPHNMIALFVTVQTPYSQITFALYLPSNLARGASSRRLTAAFAAFSSVYPKFSNMTSSLVRTSLVSSQVSISAMSSAVHGLGTVCCQT